MNADQIGRLANHIEDALMKHPCKVCAFLVDGKGVPPEEWEEYLKNQIDNDENLPQYDLVDSEILETLVYWLDEELHPERYAVDGIFLEEDDKIYYDNETKGLDIWTAENPEPSDIIYEPIKGFDDQPPFGGTND